jgi:hypothetical protein
VTGVRKDRPLEWFLAGFSLFWGVTTHLAVSDPSTTGVCPDALRPFEEHSFANLAGVLGLLHMVGLMINGTMSWTPLLRLLVTAANAGFFAWVAALVSPAEFGETGLIYAYVTLGYLWCAYVAGQDTARMRLGTYGL